MQPEDRSMKQRAYIILLSLIALSFSCSQQDTENRTMDSKGDELSLIETYRHEGEGYNPFLIGPKWQVAQLNYMPKLDMDSIVKLDVHHETDETFLLMAGQAVLIAGKIDGGIVDFQLINMKRGVLYNIPKEV